VSRNAPTNIMDMNTTRAGMRGRKTIFTFQMKTAIRQVRLKPFQDRRVKTKSRGETSN